MSEPFIGTIQGFGFNFAPRGWGNCNGALLPINQNTSLFSLLGTTYGGDGRTNFALPDLRGRSALNMGQGPGLQNYRQGVRGGTEKTTMTTAQMPAHNHQMPAHNHQLRATTAMHTPATHVAIATLSGSTPACTEPPMMRNSIGRKTPSI